VGSLAITWKKPGTGDTVSQVIDLSAPFTSQTVPAQGYFTSFTSEKGFVMLNLFAGFQLAARSARDGDARGADATLGPLETSVLAWLQKSPDPDIEDDLKYLRLFRKNLGKLQDYKQLPPPLPQNPWPND
jgi:Ca-activated chloride channel family protein